MIPSYNSPSDSRSARSLCRPAASLFRRSSARPIKVTGTPPNSPAVRPSHASSQLTPDIPVRRSTRTGGTPSWMIISGFWKSFADRPTPPNPNAASASISAWRSPRTVARAGRGLPSSVVRHAKQRGQTLTDYLQDVLEREVAGPPVEEVLDRIAGRARVELGGPAADLLRAERSSRQAS